MDRDSERRASGALQTPSMVPYKDVEAFAQLWGARRSDEMHPDDIPVAHTPSGGWHGEMPPPLLAGCDAPIVAGAPDLRGTWRAVAVEQNGKLIAGHPLSAHVERIEQCGDRVVITSAPIIHDMRADGTLDHGVDDVAAVNFAPIRVAAVFCEGRLDLHPGGYDPAKPALVSRWIADDALIWKYAIFTVTLQRVSSPLSASP